MLDPTFSSSLAHTESHDCHCLNKCQLHMVQSKSEDLLDAHVVHVSCVCSWLPQTRSVKPGRSLQQPQGGQRPESGSGSWLASAPLCTCWHPQRLALMSLEEGRGAWMQSNSEPVTHTHLHSASWAQGYHAVCCPLSPIVHLHLPVQLLTDLC